MRVIRIAIILEVLVSCSRPDATTRLPATTASSSSCRSTPSPTADWQTVQLVRPSVSLRLPPGWREKQWAVQVEDDNSSHTFRTDANLFQDVSVAETNEPATSPPPRVSRQADYTEYSECHDSIGGRPAILQAWRGGGTVFRDGQRSASFQTHLTLELEPGLYAMVSGSSADRAGQDEILAIMRTFRTRTPARP